MGFDSIDTPKCSATGMQNYKKLLDIDPYESQPTEKLEYINHVTKRMGTALRSLVEKQKAQGNQLVDGAN